MEKEIQKKWPKKKRKEKNENYKSKGRIACSRKKRGMKEKMKKKENLWKKRMILAIFVD